jgi:hypothetical protein
MTQVCSRDNPVRGRAYPSRFVEARRGILRRPWSRSACDRSAAGGSAAGPARRPAETVRSAGMPPAPASPRRSRAAGTAPRLRSRSAVAGSDRGPEGGHASGGAGELASRPARRPFRTSGRSAQSGQPGHAGEGSNVPRPRSKLRPAGILRSLAAPPDQRTPSAIRRSRDLVPLPEAAASLASDAHHEPPSARQRFIAASLSATAFQS